MSRVRKFHFADCASLRAARAAQAALTAAPKRVRCFAVTGETGVGKTALVQTLAAEPGVPMQQSNWPDSADEMKRALDLAALNKSRYLVFDGLPARVRNDGRAKFLLDFIAAPTWAMRRLGTSRLEMLKPRCVVFLVGKAVELPPDLYRLVQRIYLVAPAGGVA